MACLEFLSTAQIEIHVCVSHLFHSRTKIHQIINLYLHCASYSGIREVRHWLLPHSSRKSWYGHFPRPGNRYGKKSKLFSLSGWSGVINSRARLGLASLSGKGQGSKDQADKILMALGMSQSAAAVTEAIAALHYNP